MKMDIHYIVLYVSTNFFYIFFFVSVIRDIPVDCITYLQPHTVFVNDRVRVQSISICSPKLTKSKKEYSDIVCDRQ
jgi:hypothetical protein